MRFSNILAIFIVITLLGGVQVHALNFDNVVKVFPSDKKYSDIKIDNSFGIGQTLMEAKLIKNTESCEKECEAVIHITNYESFLADKDNFNLKFNDVKKGGTKELIYKVYVATGYKDVEKHYGYNCPYLNSPIEQCTERIAIEKELDYKILEVGSEIPVGDVYIKITGSKGKEEVIDWIPTFLGKDIDVWAIWGSGSLGVVGLNANSIHYFDDSNLTNSLKDYLSYNNFTDNATGNIASVNGLIGRAITTNNTITSGQNIKVNRNFFPNKNTSISLWFNQSNATCGNTYNSAVIFGESNYSESNYALIFSCDTLKVQFANGPIGEYNINVVSSSTYSFGQWHHVVITQNDTNTTIYVDGSLMSITKPFVPVTLTSGNAYLFDGLHFADPNMRPMKNLLIDELYTFNNTLSQDNVSALYNEGLGAQLGTGARVNINSPSNNSQQLSLNVLYNCSASTSQYYILTNISLVDNSTGTWKINQTISLAGINNTNQVFNINYSSPASILFACRACANDSTCGVTENRTISVGVGTFSYSFNNITYETKPEVYSINISYNSSSYSISALLNYGGIDYPTRIIGIGDSILISSNLNAPSVNLDTNYTLYWKYTFTNSTGQTYVNSSFFNQTVRNLSLGLCSTYSNIVVNYTSYDEDIKARLIYPISNNSYSYYISLADVINFSINRSNVNELSICSQYAINWSTYYDSTMVAYSTDKVSENYILQNYSVIPTNISLYLLNTTSSQEFLVKIKDGNYMPVKDSIIQVVRRYSDGTKNTVESVLTDSLGQSILHLVINDVYYDFYVYKDSRLIAFFENTIAVCSNPPNCEINLNINSEYNKIKDMTNRNGVYLDTYFNSTTNTYYVYFTSLESVSKTVEVGGYSGSTLVCNDNAYSLSETLTCPVSESYSNRSIKFVTYVDNIETVTEYFTISYRGNDDLRNLRLIAVAFIVPSLVMLGLTTSVIFGWMFFIIAIIGASFMLLINPTSMVGMGSFIFTFVIAVVLLLYLPRRTQ